MDTKEKVISVFDSIAAEGSWEGLYRNKLSRWNYNFIARARAVQEMLSGRIQSSVLDIGCGSGDLAPFFIEKDASYIGIDLSQQMIERAQKIYSGLIETKKASFRVADCEQLPFEDEDFELVIAVAVIEYLSDPTRALDEIMRVTKSGGLALLTVPYRQCVNYYIRALLSGLFFRNLENYL